MAVDTFRTNIELRNQSGYLIKEFTKNDIASLSWDFDRIGGCGPFSLTIKKKFNELPVASYGEYDVRVYLGPADGTTQILWFRGYVDRVVGTLDKNESIDITGFGYVRQLNRVIVNKNYSGMELGAIVKDILDTFVVPNTRITYSAADIINTGITASSLVFNTSADQAIQTLADIAGSMEWGVDLNRSFYFKKRLEYVKIPLWIRRDVALFEDTRSFDEIKNSYYLQGQNGLTYALEQTESVQLYGRRQDIIVNSSINSTTDAQNYLAALLNDSARPPRQIRIEVASVGSPYENSLPLGKVCVMGEDLSGPLYGEPKYGEKLYGYNWQAQVNTFTYTLRPGGVGVEIQAAYLPPQIGKSIKQIEKEIEQLREV